MACHRLEVNHRSLMVHPIQTSTLTAAPLRDPTMARNNAILESVAGYTRNMALPRTWLPRAEEILDVLKRMKSKQLDRAAIEELFQLQRRAAIDLLNQVGRTGDRATGFLVERTSLLSWVEKIFKEESWQLQRRKSAAEELSRSMAEVQAIRVAMAKEGRQPVAFPIVDKYLRATCASLPRAIRIEYGRITIEVAEDTPEEMRQTACQLLYEFAMALNNDADHFRDLIAANHDVPDLTALSALPETLCEE
jgi:hypothetical protein